MVMQAPHVGSLNLVTAHSPALGFQVTPTTAVRLKYTVSTNNAFLTIFLQLTSAGCVQPVGGNRVVGSYDETFDLSAYDGDTIEELQLAFNNTINQPIDVSIDEVELIC